MTPTPLAHGVFVRRVATPVVGAAPWPPFVVFALGCALSVGSVVGAIDLWHLRAAMEAVPTAHHRAHAVAQVFGFVGLFIVGISLHLAPRFFGGPLPRPAFTRGLAIASMVGVITTVAGQLGALLPWSDALAAGGAAVLAGALAAWALWLGQLWVLGATEKQSLHRFLVVGAAWWAVAAACWLASQLRSGQVPLDAVWAAALFGGAGSWLIGVFLRAGLCTLQLPHPKERALRRLFIAWQVAALVGVVAPWVASRWFVALGCFAQAVACALVLLTLRPWLSWRVSDGTLRPRAIQASFIFMAVFAGLESWAAAGALGVWAPALLRDAARHVWTLGVVTLMLFGFAGRMVPGFRGRPLRWPRIYDVGVLGLIVAVALRLVELLPTRAGLSVAASSGGVALLAIAALSTALLGSLRPLSARA